MGGDNTDTLFLVPSVICDFGVISPIGSGKNKILYSSAALSAAKFLTEVRGLPLSDFEIECDGQVFRVLRKNGRCGIIADKFSVISCGTESIKSAEIKTSLLASPLGKIRLCKTGELCSFCEEVLPEITRSREGENIIGSVAFDENGKEINATSHFCRSQGGAEAFITAVAVASYLYSSGCHGEITLTVRGTVFDTVLSEYGLLVFDRHSMPLTLYAPDIE